MKYLKLMPFNSISNASRNLREMSVASECGYEVYCYSADRSISADKRDLPFTLLTDETAPFRVDAQVPHLVRVWRVFKNMLAHAKRVRKLGMDVISCHNIRGLSVAWLACIGLHGSKRPKLIYDSHEFELGRNPRGRIRYGLLKWLEGFLTRRCAFVIVVNDSIGEELVRIHHLNQKPVAVRSTPEYWEIDEKASLEMREQFAEKLAVPKDAFILCYTGIFMPFRGLEQVIEAMALEKDVCAVWIGEPETALYQGQLDALIEKNKIADRLIMYHMQPHEELWKFISAAAAAVVMNDSRNENYKYALPNKFFEAIQSLTPVICSDTREMARIVNQYNIGLLVPSGDGKALAAAIRRLKNDKALRETFRQNLKTAKRELCWENEKRILERAYKAYLEN